MVIGFYVLDVLEVDNYYLSFTIRLSGVEISVY